MKKAKVEAVAPIKPRKSGWWITIQTVEDSILVLNIFKNKILTARHCINMVSGEYATLKDKAWTTRNVADALGF